jgi:hypothetical protein
VTNTTHRAELPPVDRARVTQNPRVIAAATLVALVLAPQSGPSAVLTTVTPDHPFHAVVVAATKEVDRTEPIVVARPPDAIATLRTERIRDVLVVVPPEVVDVDFAYDLHRMATRVDDDPFADVRVGVITGRDVDAALRFLAATSAARRTAPPPNGSLLELLGPNVRDDAKTYFWRRPTQFARMRGWRQDSVNHGMRGWPDDALPRLEGFQILHLGGHGVPERIEHGLTAQQLARLDLAGTVVFNGACWTGVTRHWYRLGDPTAARQTADDTFCLAMLDTGAVAYVAATHPDHGVPVMQEVEHVLVTGAPVGEAIRATVAGLVLARGGKALELPSFRDRRLPDLRPRGAVEWYGTASRLLYGDPRLRPCGAAMAEPFTFEASPDESGGTRVTATLRDPAARALLTNAYDGDLASDPTQFNTRAWLRIPWDADRPARRVELVGARAARALFAKATDVAARVVGHAVEIDDGECTLHVQVDLASDGLFTSPFRRVGSTVTLVVR